MTGIGRRRAHWAVLLVSAALAGCNPAPPDTGRNASTPTATPRDPLPAPAPTSTPLSVTSPSAGEAPVVIDFDASTRVTLVPSEEARDRSTACVVELQSESQQPQHLTVIGEGETEAISCDGLIAAGRVPGTAGTDRIALLYRAHSPNAQVIQPIILTRSARAAEWQTDDKLAQRISEEAGLQTIPAIRDWLRRSPR